MVARRLGLAVSVALCALVCVLCVGAGSAWAGGGSFLFGSGGEEAGQFGFQGSLGMAVDTQSGDVYASDPADQRVEKFDQSGGFLLSWGWGVIPLAEGEEIVGANEFQVCTSVTGCRVGRPGSGAGEFDSQNATGVAVDNESLSLSHGDVYVVDQGNYRVQKFDSEGKFLLMFGGHVNKTTGGDVCVAGEACGAGTEGTGDGEFSWASNHAYVAVGPGGDVYVGDKARVEVFEPSGAWKENISLSALSSEGKVKALEVNAAGDVFVKDEGVPGVREFEPGGIEMPVKFDEGSESVESVALDAAGDVFVSDTSGGPHFLKFGPSGEELADFGGSTLVSTTPAMVFDEALGELLVYGTDELTGEYGHYGVWGFPVPAAGPLVEPGSEKATPALRGAATLEATVNPEGKATEAKFEYVDEASFKASGYASAASTSLEAIGSSFEDQHVVVHLPLKALVPGTTYHWRVVAKSSKGTVAGPDQAFEEIPPALIGGPDAADVTSSSVTLEAKIDPLGASTSYRLEYGTSVSYGHVFSGNVGEGTDYVQIAYHVQELEANTVYHYRLVSESEVGTIEGADRTFTTQLAGGTSALPDGRVWELVSPPYKGGAVIEDTERSQAASDGSGIVYTASEPLGEGVVGRVGHSPDPIPGATELSMRLAGGGWRTRDISPRQTLPPEGEPAIELFNAEENFMTFSPDLSLGVLEPRLGLSNTPQSPEATERTLYVRNDTSETYEPLVTPANVPAGTKWAPSFTTSGNGTTNMGFLAATPDLSHVLFSDWAALTPEASTEKIAGSGGEYSQNLYEWSGGKLQLVNILPGVNSEPGKSVPGAAFGSNAEGEGSDSNPWAMSGDGRWIVFRYSRAANQAANWYVRDMVEHRTVAFGRPRGHTRFETMSRDGSRLFYLEPPSGAVSAAENEEGELYVLDPATGVTTDLTASHLAGEHSAGVQNTLLGISEDGSYVYFVAKGVLADGAVRGQNNLYVMHEQGGAWKTTLIATLSSEDEPGWRPSSLFTELEKVTRRVTPDGRYVTFMSDRPLTGYDNTDAISGQPDEEVFLYDAETNRLVCASCNPSGARPTGVHDQIASAKGLEQGLLMDQSDAWGGLEEAQGHWLAANIAPDWHVSRYNAFHRVSYLSDSGRLFFNSSDALVPQDTNGLADVYEYEPPGVGDCTSASTTFSERSGGCVSLISSGQSAAESTFLEASETGDDVFFITAAKLVGEDYDTAYDVYDAHVCTTVAPCRAEAVSPPACSSGDSCKAAPSPQPEIFGPAPSATFNGTGNVVEEAKKSVVKHKRKVKPKKHAKSKRKKKGKKARRLRIASKSRKGGR
jgi:Tol biopolymer transport system component